MNESNCNTPQKGEFQDKWEEEALAKVSVIAGKVMAGGQMSKVTVLTPYLPSTSSFLEWPFFLDLDTAQKGLRL